MRKFNSLIKKRVALQWTLFALFFLPALLYSAVEKQAPPPPQSRDELRHVLEKILQDTHTPGASIALVDRDAPDWVVGLGQADVASSRPATPETLFRIGSISKSFTSLAILILVEQGKLSLDDPVHKLAPEVWFENPWEATDPIRVVHLLEHTTGWDDAHFREFAQDWPGSKGLKEALDFDHHSRISRWRPGTRMAYSNSGAPVAAYLVEKLTNQRFEDFVGQNLFVPIGMHTATYFQPPPQSAATLYHDDGTTPYPYWNLIFRPSGAINASAKDMAAYLRFYLNRGANILPPPAIDRMETPTSTWSAKAGLKPGYGLSNYWTIAGGFVYHGHNGGVDGGLSEMLYLPVRGVGYFYSINSGSNEAAQRIGKAIRDYLTRSLPKPPAPPPASLPPGTADYAGFYQPDSTRFQMTRFLDRLAGLTWVHLNDGHLILTGIDGNQVFVPDAGGQFHYLPGNGTATPVATLLLLPLNDEGRFLGTGTQTMKRLPSWLAILEILLTAFVLLSTASILLYAPFWILGGLSPARRRPAERAVRLLPLLSLMSLFIGATGIIWDNGDAFVRLGNLTVWSAALFLGTILFAAFALAAAVAVSRARTIRPAIRAFSIAVTAALLIAAAYLTYWGIIGVRTWV